MQGYELKFNVYANSQEEADTATAAIKAYISRLAGRGIAVTAARITTAVERWRDNVFVANYFK